MTNVVATPLQRIVGFHVSEQTYDLLNLEEQIILDLKIQGFMNIDIAGLFGLRPGDIKHIMERIRMKLANTELQRHLELRITYKENHARVADENLGPTNGFQVQDFIGDIGVEREA